MHKKCQLSISDEMHIVFIRNRASLLIECLYPNYLEMHDSELSWWFKARRSLQGMATPLPRASTQHWIASWTPYGQADKHTSSALWRLAI